MKVPLSFYVLNIILLQIPCLKAVVYSAFDGLEIEVRRYKGYLLAPAFVHKQSFVQLRGNFCTKLYMVEKFVQQTPQSCTKLSKKCMFVQ